MNFVTRPTRGFADADGLLAEDRTPHPLLGG